MASSVTRWAGMLLIAAILVPGEGLKVTTFAPRQVQPFAAKSSVRSLALRSAVKMSLSRREAIATAFTAAIALGSAGFPSSAHAEGPYSLPPLPYPYNALEPYIDEDTMKFHHDKHHQAYVTNVNKALEGKPAVSLVELQKGAIKAGPAIRNNGGGHYNHALFWKNLGPASKSGAPSPALAKAIDASFGSLDKMTEAFSAAAATRFGSGWAWLGVGPDGKLVIDSTPNQDNPLMEGAGCKPMIPILGLDVWEHAYYLKYQNRRPDYIKAFFSVINWSEVSSNYENYAAKGVSIPI